MTTIPKPGGPALPTNFKRAQRPPRPLTQPEKNAAVSRECLDDLRGAGRCSIKAIDERLVARGLTARAKLTLTTGTGGTGGLNAFVYGDAVLVCRDNLLIFAHALGDQFKDWLQAQKMTADEFVAWADSLPSA